MLINPFPGPTTENKENRTQGAAFFILVAGAGFAPTPTGYEPVEVLLLQPAMQ